MRNGIRSLIMLAAFGAAQQAVAQCVVVNEFRNQTPDAVELLVVASNLNMQGFIIKDFSSNGNNDSGKAYTFSSDALWSSVRAGSIIVLRNDNTAADVSVGGADYNIDVGLANTTYFSAGGGTFDIATDEIIMVKTNGSATAGIVGSIHAFATDTAGSGTNFTAIAAPKLRTTSGDTGAGESVEANNSTSALADFNGTDATGDDATGSIGTWNTAANQTYIESLRGGPSGPVTNVQFTAASASAGEGSTNYTITVYKTVDSGSVTGQVALSGTATNGVSDDYTIDTTNFVLNGATTAATFVVTINDDVSTESAETVVLTLANVTGGSVASPSVFTLTLTDNDAAPVVAEGIADFRFNTGPHLAVSAKDANITVSAMALSTGGIESNQTTGTVFPDEPFIEETGGWAVGTQASAKNFQFTITPAGGYQVSVTAITFRALATAAGPSAFGYDIGGGVATYAVNAPDGTLVVVSQAVAGVVNQSSPITFMIQGWTNGSRATSGTGAFRLDDVVVFGTVTASGPPATNVQFTAASASAAESSVAYTVTVYKTLSAGDITGQVALSGTAIQGGGNDYTVDTTNFTLNGASTSATFVITINDDAVVESAETVILTLANVTGGSVGSPSAFTLTLTDNDVLPENAEGILSFRFTTSPHLQVTTNEPGITVSSLSATAGSIGTNVTTGTYFPNEPYIQASGGWTNSTQITAKALQFTITPSSGYQVTITGISFRAYATGAGPSALGYDIGGLASSAVNLTNDSLLVVSQAVAGVVNQTAPVLVQIQGWTNGTRATSGTGDLRIDDVLIYGEITATGPTTNVQFTLASATVSEEVGTYNVTVYKSLADGNVTGQVALSGTATLGGGNDYTISATNFALNGATTAAVLTITVNDDAGVEPTETVILTLANVTGGGVASPSVFTLSITNNDVAPPPSVNVWINEMHYDNVGGDLNEGFEVAGPAGTDLSSYLITLYEGADGSVYSNRTLSGVIANQMNGFGVVWFDFSNASGTGLQPGPDGFALSLVEGGVTSLIKFWSYEGTFVGAAGPANGVSSTDIGVSEGGSGTNSTPIGHSLQLCGTGTSAVDFVWTTWTATNSMGTFNVCQTIPNPNDLDNDGLPDDWENSRFGNTTNTPAGDVDEDGFPNGDEFVAFTDPTNSASYFRATSVTNAGGPFIVVPSVTGRQYRLLWSPLLGVQTWTNVVAGPVAGTGGNISLGADNTATSVAVRLSVELQ